MSSPIPNPPRLDPTAPGTESCGCCAGSEPKTPREIANRAGLSAIAYRIGTYADFRASLHSGLGELRTRDDDDFTIGLMDAFACAADVLTFYQERIANESYLGTAREDVSLREMGQLIGYRLRPGVAAETALAFTFETPPLPPAAAKPEPGMFVTGVPAEVRLEAGVAVRSVPAPGEQPQVFETVEPLTARPAWNALRPWSSERVVPAKGATFTYLQGVDTRLRAGDALLFVGDEYFRNGATGQWDFRILAEVAADNAHGRTRVSWQAPLAGIDAPQDPTAQTRVFALRRRAAVYGHNAPAWGSLTVEFRANYLAAFPELSAAPSASLEAAAASFAVAAQPPTSAEDGTAASSDAAGVSARAVVQPAQWTRFVISPRASSVDLDAIYQELSAGSFVVLAKGASGRGFASRGTDRYVELYSVSSVTEVSREEFAMAAKVTRLELDGANYAQFQRDVRGTSVFGQSEELQLAEYPVTSPIAGNRVPVDVAADGLLPGRRLLIRGTRVRDGVADVHGATLVAATAALDRASGTLLEIDPPLPAALLRESVVVHGNVALASHGETVSQILGAGNAAAPFQRFELKQSPLTYRAAANELGAASELTVRVDDIAWRQRETLYAAAPKDRVFTLRTDEQGRDFVQFGNGVRGARLPSGVNNVRATYRKGLGTTGNLAADSLTQPTQRPLGLKGVSNPLPALGGTDPEPASEARQTMPLMTRTLGRAVSMLDYEDFARAFAGIAKARAQVLRLPAGPVVAITIAGADNATIGSDNPLWTNLAAALAASGDPHVAVRLLAHHAGTFRLGLKVKRDPAYESSRVLAAVESALRARFGFAARALGQAVQQSDVIATAQSVPGVVAVDLDLLYGGSAPAAQRPRSLQVRLLASRMRVVAGVQQPDEILTLDPQPFERLEEMP
jgi:hypothetical protein